MRYGFSFEWARGSNSDISLVSCPNDIKFWQMIGLTSGLIWYFITKVGFFLKKRSFCRFSKKRRKFCPPKKWHQKSTVTSKGCPSGHSRLPYSLVFLTKGQEDFPTYSLTPKYTTDKDRRLCDLCEEKTFSSRRFLENRQKLRFFQKEPHFCYKNQISPLVRLIICQNLRSFGQETTEISPFDPLVHSNEKR